MAGDQKGRSCTPSCRSLRKLQGEGLRRAACPLPLLLLLRRRCGSCTLAALAARYL